IPCRGASPLRVSIPTMSAPPLRQEPTVPALSGWGRSNVLWLAVSLCMLALLATAAWLVISDDEQPLPPFLAGGGARQAPAAPAPRDGLRLAGSGSNLPITRALSAAFPRERSRHAVV